MTSDVANSGTIYYVDYVGPIVPYCTGGSGAKTYNSAHVTYPLTLTLTSAQTAGQIYDIFFFDDTIHGAWQIGLGPAWSSSSSRGTGAGTTQISQNYLDGVWRNDQSFTPVNGTITLPTLSACNGTYLGSVYITGTGTTSMNMSPAAAAGGTNNFVGLYNAYNRVPIISMSSDSTTSWTYATPTWRAADNSTSNRVTYLDGLAQSSVTASYVIETDTSNGVVGVVGITLDSATASPAQPIGVTSLTTAQAITGYGRYQPQLGVHFAQAMEYSGGATTTFTGNGVAFSGLMLEMED